MLPPFPTQLKILRRFLIGCAWLLASAAGWAAAASGELTYDLRGDEAEQALKKYAAVSGRQVIFLSEVTEGVRTKAVHGHYSARAALDLMLTGTTLVAKEDEQSGALVISRATAPAQRVIALPPYVVEEITARPPWRYAEAPGLEAISLCMDGTTSRLVAHSARLRYLLDLIVPRDFQGKTDVPGAFVLYSSQWEPKMSQAALADLTKAATAGEKNAPAASPGALSMQFLPNFQFCDQDARSLFAVVDEVGFSSGRMTLSAHYVRYLLQSRAPALPHWFVEGMMELYKTILLESGPPNDRVTGSMMTSEGAVQASITISKAVWVNEVWTTTLRKDPKTKVQFIPWSELFSDQLPAQVEKGYDDRWRSQLSLLIRWAADPDTAASRREGMWKFVDRAGIGAPTEAEFKACFGLDYRALDQELHAYLRTAVRSPIYLRPENLPEPPEIVLRDATDSEVSRLKGDLNRLEIAYVKEMIPALAGKYADQARRTLHKAYDRGDRDPRLLAVLGLLEVDVGNDVAARPLLAAAAAGKVVRPRAYYELARINLAREQFTDPAAPLAPGPAAEILQLLDASRRQAPPLPETYALIGEVWLRSEGQLSREQLAVLDEGIRLFPRWVRLITAAALLNARNGYLPEAQALINRGLQRSDQELEKSRLRKLQEMISASTPPQRK